MMMRRLAFILPLLAALLLRPASVEAQPAFGQTKEAAGGATTTGSITFDSSTTAGNLITVCVRTYNNTTVNSVDDNKGNTYSAAIDSAPASGRKLTTFYAKNISGGASHTVTAHFADGVFWELEAAEWTGVDTTAPLDQHAINVQSNMGTGTDAVTSTSVTTTTGNQLIWGCTWDDGEGATLSNGTNFTNVSLNASSRGVQYRVLTSAGSVASTSTASGNDGGANFISAVMTFKQAAGGGGTPRMLLLGVGP